MTVLGAMGASIFDSIQQAAQHAAVQSVSAALSPFRVGLGITHFAPAGTTANVGTQPVPTAVHATAPAGGSFLDTIPKPVLYGGLAALALVAVAVVAKKKKRRR